MQILSNLIKIKDRPFTDMDPTSTYFNSTAKESRAHCGWRVYLKAEVMYSINVHCAQPRNEGLKDKCC